MAKKAAPAEIVLPANGWEPRFYQHSVWNYMQNGGKRAVCIWHRRAGKDDVCLHLAACAAVQRPGNYWHMLPEAKQARKAIWSAVNPHTGKRRVDEAFPKELRKRVNDQEMFIELINGATWQVVGSDNYDSLVGAPPVGIVFSEWALADPMAWAYLRPILLENDGWALFITTPRGRNHGYTFYAGARDDPAWFAEKLTAHDTDVFTKEQLQQEAIEYVRQYGPDDGEARYRQEYLCDWEAAIPGAFYAKQMEALERHGQVTHVPVEPSVPVNTAWDIGMTDDTAIWFFQVVGQEIRIVDYYQSHGHPVEHYARIVHERGYTYGDHWAPHDAVPKSFASGRSVVEHAADHGIKMRIVSRHSVEDGIEAVRKILPFCWFDKDACSLGIEAMREYRREWDEKHKVFKKQPLHNWASHPADAFRYMAMGYRANRPEKPAPKVDWHRQPSFNDVLRTEQQPERRKRV